MRDEIVQSVRQAGVVGAGGAGFPAHVKISSAAKTVIINGAECEPLLRVDQQLMAVKAEELVRGLEAMMEATGASEGIIALKGKYKDSSQALKPLVQAKPIRLFELADFFPAGDEQVTVYEVLGRVVPEGGIPLQVDCVVSNVETVINVAKALEGIPVTSSYVTVTGEVDRPVTLKVPIGTPVSEVLGLAGVKETAGLAVIDGGPMMGRVLDDLSVPVTKTTKGLIVLPAGHQLAVNKTLSMPSVKRRAKSACIQCALCSDICPRNLLGHRLYPHLIMRGLNYLTPDEKTVKSAFLCCECGACELYGCPMMLSPRQVNAAFKKELARQGMKHDFSDAPAEVLNVREYRKIPSRRLVARLGLSQYDGPAPMSQLDHSPGIVYIPLRQHIGVPGMPIVTPGQMVEKGQLIAAIPEGGLGASIHASISGTVKQVTDYIEIVSNRERGEV